MVPSLSRWVVLSLALSFASASPLEGSVLHRRQSVTTLTPEQVAAYKPYSYYASAGACQPSLTLNWTCGTACEANPDFKPVASGGNGDSVQFWYVGYAPSLDTVIVSHQGTDFSKLLPILTDINIILSNLDDILFPGVSSDIMVHSGFKEAQADAAEIILSYVEMAMSTYSTNSVTAIGHSLGGAIALLDGVYLDLQLPSASVSVVSYGMPRVGNQAFADYVDANVNVTHVNNKKDPVPILPWREIGYHHCSGEKHITDSNEWVNCPGQDSPDAQCIVGEVGNLLESNAADHIGPYDGVTMGSC
ncbi:alpha/beta-hydrolase [Desarmillaria tabescens]|uniref:Alpha/beta-hydrolase n=1 Tax=Armillaria tabescens TaxID=1929756 RepID=A0AA39NJK2_ARMTA|nr:alpha/beta-hydrolase [Desarmillaria tabescens]KAK0466790.1 alpha/beta-hydrolase [Desarmillaria tabescens]